MGGSSGGSSGKVDYPTYMKDVHGDWLNDSGSVFLSTDITTIMDEVIGASPLASAAAYDPEPQLADMSDSVNVFDSRYGATVASMDYSRIMSEIKSEYVDYPVSEAEILASVQAFSDSLDHQVEVMHLPRFQRGMQDINAVQSSSFVLGSAMLEEEAIRKKAEYESDLRMQVSKQHSAEIMANIGPALSTYMQMMQMKLTYADSIARLFIDTNKLSIIAYKEQYESDHELDVKDALWDLEVFRYGGNLLGSIAGGSALGDAGPSKTVSAIGGAMSGAATGAQIGSSYPPYGAAIGAGVGAIVGGIGGWFSK